MYELFIDIGQVNYHQDELFILRPYFLIDVYK